MNVFLCAERGIVGRGLREWARSREASLLAGRVGLRPTAREGSVVLVPSPAALSAGTLERQRNH